MVTKWSGALVKQMLPRINVKLFGRIYKGHVSGRRNKFASVWLQLGGHIYERQYAWSTVARALNTDKALSIG